MTRIVFVSPGTNLEFASGPQFGVKHTLVGPDGSRAVFNDPFDADYVGWLTSTAGFDSPEVRESADDLVGDDGGVHGNFYYGRRPVILEGQIESRPSNAERNRRMTRLQRASNAMRKDATLRWAVEGGIEQTVKVRRQQPLRISGGYLKTFQLALVSADYRIYGAAIQEMRFDVGDHTKYASNHGSAQTPPIITVYGPAEGVEIHNHTTGSVVAFGAGLSLTATDYVTVDYANGTVMKNGTTNVYDTVIFPASTWWQLQPGDNNIAWHATATSTTAASSMVMTWQDAWV